MSTFPGAAPLTDDEWRALLAAAAQAPSGDNTQPWRFHVDRGADAVAIAVDPERDRSPMNAGQRMARIACGAALENLVQSARARGIAADIAVADGRATVRLRRDGVARADAPSPARVTNRRTYDGRQLPDSSLVELTRMTLPSEGVTTRWIADRRRLPDLAAAIGRADALMFSRPAMRHAFLAQVRFASEGAAPPDDGLPLGCLEVGRWEARGMRLMGAMPQALFVAAGSSAVFAAKARALVGSASALCVVSSTGRGVDDDVAVGRAMQRAWLAVSRIGACAQPMMSLAVIANLLEHGDAAAVADLGARRARRLLDGFTALVPELGAERPAAILRIGFAPAPSARTGRRPMDQVLDLVGAEGAAGSRAGALS